MLFSLPVHIRVVDMFYFLNHSNCTSFQLLVDWTRGKNLIFSSAALSATELRGPQDVSNLFSLLGLQMECAKAAISKNCRYEHLLKLYLIYRPCSSFYDFQFIY